MERLGLKKNFISEKFKSIFLVSTLSMLVEYIVMLSDNVIAGNLVGERAVAAITLVGPAFSISVFFSFLVSQGTIILMAFAVGEGDREKANRYFSQGLILCFAVGAGLTVLFLLFREEVFRLGHVSQEVAAYAAQYYRYLCFIPLLQALNALFYGVVLNEGGERICMISSAAQVGGNIAMSLLLCSQMGVAGVSLASVLSNVLADAILCLQFFQKQNQLRFTWYCRLRSVLSMLKYSVNDSFRYLYLAAFQVSLNLFLVYRFGDNALITAAVILNLLNLMLSAFDGIGEGMQVLVNVYRGEKNQRGIFRSMRLGIFVSAAEGLTVTAALLLLSGQIPRLFGVKEGALLSQTQTAVCIYALSAVFISIGILLSAYYCFIDEIKLSLALSFLLLLFFPILCAVVFGGLWGLTGVWIGLAISSAAALAAGFLLVGGKCRDGKKVFPLLLDQEVLENQAAFDVPGTQDGVMELVGLLGRELTERGAQVRTKFRIELITEETGMLAVGKNPEHDFRIEASLLFDDGVTLVLRDNGQNYDVTEENKDLTSMQEYAADRIIGSHKEKKYMLTSGYNRTVFRF